MAAIPTPQRLISLVLISLAAGVIAGSGQIIAMLGTLYGSTVAGIAIVIIFGLREFVKEAGLQTGELNNEEEVKALKEALPQSEPTSQPLNENEGA